MRTFTRTDGNILLIRDDKSIVDQKKNNPIKSFLKISIICRHAVTSLNTKRPGRETFQHVSDKFTGKFKDLEGP